ncbi:hypothetical protein FE257_009849 [Aspergillus nanangensis]|uniref:Protein kinase domain-containing protein n=1 Tax=Aspergillus nanangensis TaxID=2582783 RepID=A0AAD4GY92_ASPNN|nr:hypothetical protein FE257_009849 [Aspergillus nanangensis]
MFVFVRQQYYSPLWGAFRTYFFRPFSLFFRVFIQYSSASSVSMLDKQDAFSPNIASGTSTPTCNCNTYSLRRQKQHGLETVGAGASGQVYKVDEDIVLKSSQVFEPPSAETRAWDRFSYANETLFHNNLTNDERTFIQLLQKHKSPHPNIIEAVETRYPEGIYFRKYKQLDDVEIPSQPGRIRWYLNIVAALTHIHDLGIAHSDIRLNNILFDSQGREAYLCDFSTCSPEGKKNMAYPYPDHDLPTHVVSDLASEKTDRFIMGSLIFQLEHGMKPTLIADRHGSLIVPRIHTGNEILDSVIEKAWLGHYVSTAQMLENIESIGAHISAEMESPESEDRSTEALRQSIERWRGQRERLFGKHSLYFCSH